MLARVYFIAGTLLLGGYGVICWEGWEFTDPLRLSPVPVAGAVLHSSSGRNTYTSSSSSSGSRSGWVIFGGK